MYAKVLQRLDPPVAGIIMDTHNGSTTVATLRKMGWVDFKSEPPVIEGSGAIRPASLSVIVKGVVVLKSDANPVSPPGWWHAVSAHDDLIIVWVVEGRRIDLRAPDTAGRLADIMDGAHGAWSRLRVTHE